MARRERMHVLASNIAEIASGWGFSDQSNFAWAFRRTYGVSPREYRRNHRPLVD
ncbi:helix-turn-helix domain-containing protein [Mycolicibacterium sp. CBM1]